MSVVGFARISVSSGSVFGFSVFSGISLLLWCFGKSSFVFSGVSLTVWPIWGVKVNVAPFSLTVSGSLCAPSTFVVLPSLSFLLPGVVVSAPS